MSLGFSGARSVAGLKAFDEVRQDRAWKLFMLLLRMASPPACKGWSKDSGLIWWRRASEAEAARG